MGTTLAVAVGFLSGCTDSVDNMQYQRSQPVGEICGSYTVGQSFISHYAGLSRIDVFMTTYARRNTQEVTFRLKPDPASPKDIATVTLNAAEIRDGTYHRFSFPPLPDSRGKTYFFAIESPDSTPGDAITAWYSPLDAYPEGAMYVNGQVQDGDLAFRTYYDYGLGVMVRDVWRGVTGNLRLITFSVALFLLPGYALFTLLLPRSGFDFIQRLIVSVGLSTALVPLLLLFCTLIGLKLDTVKAMVMMLAFGFIALWSTMRELAREGKFGATRALRVKIDGIYILLVFLLVLSLIVRFVPVRDLAIPPGTDGYHHALISQLIVENGKVPESYEPYAPLKSFTYHFGFHSVVAFLHWLTGEDVIQLTLVIGQMLNALLILSVFLFVFRLTEDRVAGLIGALMVGLISVFPAYYVYWGRFTQLTGLVILPIAIVLMMEWIDGDERHWGYALAASIALAGLFLSHYRILMFYPPFAFLYLFYKSWAKRGELRMMKGIWLRFAILVLFTFVLIAPWLRNLLINYESDPLRPRSYLGPGYFSIDRIGEASSFYSNIPLLVLSLGGIIWGLWRREHHIILIFIWALFLLIASNPYWIPLPGVGMVEFVTVLISMFLPASAFVGYLMANLWRSIHRAFPKARLIGGVVLAAIAFLGAKEMLGIFDPIAIYVGKADMMAMRWIQDNVTKGAKFLVNATIPEWAPDYAIGIDAGYWIPLLTGRETTLPPVIYSSERPVDEGYFADVLVLSKAANSLDTDDTLRLLKAKGVTHIYIGERESVIRPEELIQSPNYQLVYHDRGVWIFEVDYDAG